jgi:hypothetical protein
MGGAAVRAEAEPRSADQVADDGNQRQQQRRGPGTDEWPMIAQRVGGEEACIARRAYTARLSHSAMRQGA